VDNPATGASVHAKTIYALRPASLILFSMCFDCFLLWPDRGRIQKKELQEFRSYRSCRIESQYVFPVVVIAGDAAFLHSVTPATPELLDYRPRRCPCASTSSLIRN
jgi:hypothetical protein